MDRHLSVGTALRSRVRFGPEPHHRLASLASGGGGVGDVGGEPGAVRVDGRDAVVARGAAAKPDVRVRRGGDAGVGDEGGKGAAVGGNLDLVAGDGGTAVAARGGPEEVDPGAPARCCRKTGASGTVLSDPIVPLDGYSSLVTVSSVPP